MAVVRFVLRIVLLPVLLALKLAELVGIFLTSFASILFYLLAGLSFLLAVFGYLAGICSGGEALSLLIVGFISFVLPQMAAWVIGGIGAVEERLKRTFRK